jgi:hypothetical protein
MMVKQELVNSLREMEGIEVKDEGNSGDHSRFWELRSVWTFWNIGLASLLKLYLTEIIQILFSIFSRTFEFR